MSRGYSATPLWGLSRNSAVAAVFSKISRPHIVRISAYIEQNFTKIARTQCETFSAFQIKVIIYAKMISKLYTIISNKL